jgi:hypothetical protein
MSNSRQTEKKVNANIEHFSAEAQQEVTRLRKELDDLRIRARPKVQEAENFLSSPQVTGFIGGKSSDTHNMFFSRINIEMILLFV